MNAVRLTGQLLCKTREEARLVIEHLPHHIALTRAEPGCMHFDVVPTDDPLLWQVDECFEGEAAFADHQARAASSEWGRATTGIERRYSLTGRSL